MRLVKTLDLNKNYLNWCRTGMEGLLRTSHNVMEKVCLEIVFS